MVEKNVFILWQRSVTESFKKNLVILLLTVWEFDIVF